MKYLHLLLCLLVLFAAVLPAGRAAAQGPVLPPPPVGEPQLPVVHFPCGYGAKLASQGYCIYGKVRSANNSLPNVQVVAERQVAGQWVVITDDITGQRPIDAVGEAGFLLVLPPQTPKNATIRLRATVNNKALAQRFLLTPDPLSLSQEIDLLVGGANLPPLFGRVYMPGATKPIEHMVNVTLTYRLNNITTSLPSSTAPNALFGAPIFGFTQLPPAGTSLILEATDPTSPSLRMVQNLIWEGQPTLVDLYLGWDCDYTIPRRPPNGMPENYCIGALVRLDGVPIADAALAIGVGTTTLTATTVPLTDTLPGPRFNVAIDIGEALALLNADEEIIVSASYDNRTNILRIPVNRLRGDIANGVRARLLTMDLLPEWSPADQGFDLTLNNVTSLARHGNDTYAVADGQIYVDYGGTRAFTATMSLPVGANPREVALCGTNLLALTAQGLYTSTLTYPITWFPANALAVPNLNGRSLAVRGSTVVIGRGTSSEQIIASNDCGASWGAPISLPDTPGRPITTMAASSGAFFAATNGGAGVYRSEDGVTWASFANANFPTRQVNALAILQQGATCTIYALAVFDSTQAQLLSSECNSSTWTRLGSTLPAQATDLAASLVGEDAVTLFATSNSGLYQFQADTWLPRAITGDSLRMFTVVTQTTEEGVRAIVGTLGRGVWVYRNVEPELDVGLVIDPPGARPNHIVTATITLGNIGGAPFNNVVATVAISPALQIMAVRDQDDNILPGPPLAPGVEFILPSINLAPGEQRPFTMQLKMQPPVDTPIWPDDPLIQVTANVTDRLVGNNEAQANVASLPAEGHDVIVNLVAERQPRVGSNSPITLTALLDNVGEIDATEVKLELLPLPEGVKVSLNNWPYTFNRVPGTESTRSCSRNCKLAFRLSFTRPVSEIDLFSIGVRVSAINDRMGSNNEALIELSPRTRPAEYLFLTNLSRTELLEPGNQKVRYALQNFKTQNSMPVVEFMPLDSELKLVMQKIDAALSSANYTRTVELNLDANMIVRRKVFGWLAGLDSAAKANFKGIIIVGGDRVIPYGVVPEDARSSGDNLAERAFANDQRNYEGGKSYFRLSPVYATLMQNAYPSDDVYAFPPSMNVFKDRRMPAFTVSRLVENSAQIHSQLEAYTENKRQQIDITAPVGLIGYDLQLTRDQWLAGCANWGGLGPICMPTQAAFTQSAAPPLKVAIFSDHGTIGAIGDATAKEIPGKLLSDTTPLAMTVSCHTGLSVFKLASLPGEILSSQPLSESSILVPGDENKRRAGGAYMASIPYAYASVGTTEYNERLALIFQRVLNDATFMGNGRTVGEIFQQVKQRYINEQHGEMEPIDWKVVWGLALYGLPMQKVVNPRLALLANDNTASLLASQLPLQNGVVLQELNPPLSYSLITTDTITNTFWETTGRPVYALPPGVPGEVGDAGRLGEHSTRQPYWQIILNPISNEASGTILVPRGVLVNELPYTSLPNFDPFVIEVLPMSRQPLPLKEPALPPLVGWEQSTLLTGVQLGDRYQVRLWSGQYGNIAGLPTERLIINPRLQIVYGPPGGDPGLPAGQIAACPRGPEINVVVKSDTAAGGKVVYTLDDGSWRSVTLERYADLWTASIPNGAKLEFFVQLYDQEGDVATLTPNTNSYYNAANADCSWVYKEKGAVAIYTFDEGAGNIVNDSMSNPLSLQFAKTSNNEWVDGGLLIKSATTIRSAGAASKINTALKQSNEFSFELWVTPVDAAQYANRLLTISQNAGKRNLSINQGFFNSQISDLVSVPLRTTKTGLNGGEPAQTAPGSWPGGLSHLVYTRAKNGSIHLYINGVEQVALPADQSKLSNWDVNYPLVLGRETNGGNAWLGTYHLVTIYKRAMTAEEVGRAYLAGPERR
jgi:hypothetical protein